MRCLIVLLALGFLAPARAAIGDNSVGMNVHDGRQDFIDACVALGVRWVRLDGDWWAIQAQGASSYNWSTLDRAVDAATAAGLQVFITLAYTPAWVPRRDNGDGWHGNDLPHSSAEWVQFVTQAVRRYQDRVTHFGLWNEANLEGFLNASAAEYWIRIVAPGAAAVRAACGYCLVLGPDLAHVGAVDDYLEDLLAQPAVDGVAPVQAFDILTHHIYQSFPQLGVELWDGDRFFNALDQQRFSWPVASRRSLRQVLDAAGYHDEVWITETGYRATPDDASEEQRQATYLQLVLAEQLARDWYTNTFFYEIYDCRPDQPDCTIDGFGLMRASSGAPGNRSFPSSYRRKPAFTALQQYLAEHPEILAPAQARDGGGILDDAGLAADAPAVVDGGAGTDLGIADRVGTETSAHPDAVVADARSLADGAVTQDALALTPVGDASAGRERHEGPSAPDAVAGCGCHQAAAGSVPGLAGLTLAMLWGRRRRRNVGGQSKGRRVVGEQGAAKCATCRKTHHSFSKKAVTNSIARRCWGGGLNIADS